MTLHTTGKSFKTNDLIIIFSAKTNLLISYSLFYFFSTQTRLPCLHENKTHQNVYRNRKVFLLHISQLPYICSTQPQHLNTRKKSSCFLRKALYAGQGDLTHQSHIPERTRGKGGPRIEMAYTQKANQRENENWVLFLKDWNSIVTRLSYCWATMHFHTAFRIWGWGDRFYLGAQTPSFLHPFFSTHFKTPVPFNQSLLSLSTTTPIEQD